MITLQAQNSKPVTDKKVVSYDDVSKFFSLPLSDAADALGACRSDLKKVCYENGLVRWPYRKILSGKSVEEIKMGAARESHKELAEFLKATRERNDASASSLASLSPGSPSQSKNSTPTPETYSLRGFLKQQQQGNKNSPNRPLDLQNSSLTNRTSLSLDEFKYGFPSDGLSIASNKWWDGSKDNIQAEEQKSTEQKIITESSLLGKTGLLTAVRKRGFEEGKALKVGVYRNGIAKKLGRNDRVLLLGIFKSSLPSQCSTWF